MEDQQADPFPTRHQHKPGEPTYCCSSFQVKEKKKYRIKFIKYYYYVYRGEIHRKRKNPSLWRYENWKAGMRNERRVTQKYQENCCYDY